VPSVQPPVPLTVTQVEPSGPVPAVLQVEPSAQPVLSQVESPPQEPRVQAVPSVQPPVLVVPTQAWPSPRRVQALQVEPSPQAQQPQPSVQEPVTQTELSLQPRPEQPDPSEQMPAVLQAGPSVQSMPA
jgi:hypothetical protein